MAGTGALNAASVAMPDEDDDPTGGVAPPPGGGDLDNAIAYSTGTYDPALNAVQRQGMQLQPPGPFQLSPGVLAMGKSAQEILGKYNTGALSDAQQQSRAALDFKRQKINEAMERLSSTGADAPGAVNIPLLMAASAMGRPTYGGFAGSLANAGEAGGQALMQQRQADRQNAVAMGNLGIEGADVGVQGAEADQAFGEKMLDLGLKSQEQATKSETYEQARHNAETSAYYNAQSRIQAAKEAAQARRDVANIQQSWQVDRTDMMANKGRYKPLNKNTADGTASLYVDTTTGKTITGPPLANPSPRGQTALLADELMHTTDSNGNPLARNPLEALQLIRDPNFTQKNAAQLNAARERIAGSAAQLDPDYSDHPQDTIMKYRKFYGLPEKPTPVPQAGLPTPPAGTAPATPAPRAAPAAAPAALPARPSGIPPGAKYSPSQGRWWWQSNGKWQSATGQ